MKVKNLKPNIQIAEYVERLLIIENSQSNDSFSLPLFANGSPTLLFISPKAIMGNKAASHLTLFGQTLFPDTLTFTGGFTLIAYFLKPYSLNAIFGVMAPELTDSPIDLGSVKPKKAGILELQLLNAKSTNQMLLLLDQFISGLIADARCDCPGIRYAANKIAEQPTPKILGRVQNELHITERTFQRMFEKNIGISPNLYRRVCQFNSAFQQLNNRHFSKLSDLAFHNGYADQSHFVRAFKEFTHLLPTEYLDLGEPPEAQ
ncbi:MAG TPA: helix-turn-helix domain-containing protein [Puia sp.]|nr:helix-turn-helix domain-containing protein [Puia sp.]